MRWSVRLRKIATVLALGAGAGAIAGLPASPAHAEGPYHFTCRGPLAPGGTVAVNISVSSRELAVGQPLVVQWQLGVQSPVKVGDPFDDRRLDKGAHLAVTGRVHATGVWSGQGTIDATGTQFYEAERLRQPENLPLGAVADGQVIASRPGTGALRIGTLVLDLAPAEAVWDDEFDTVRDFSVGYEGGWTRNDGSSWPGETPVGGSLHETDKEGATARFTFVGTGVDLIGMKNSDMSRFELTVDDGHPPAEYREVHDAYWPVAAEPRLRETFPVIRDLPYGKYTLTVKNLIDGKHARVDGFRVHASTADNSAASPYRTVCRPPENVPLIPITVTEGGGPDEEPGPTEEPTGSPSPSPTDGNGDGDNGNGDNGNGGNGNGGNGSSATPSPGSTPTPSQVLVTTTVPASPRPTQTVTSTVTASPQVRITPSGAAATGEAPVSGPPPGALIALGTLLLGGGLAGGIALRRHRAAHAGEGPMS